MTFIASGSYVMPKVAVSPTNSEHFFFTPLTTMYMDNMIEYPLFAISCSLKWVTGNGAS